MSIHSTKVASDFRPYTRDDVDPSFRRIDTQYGNVWAKVHVASPEYRELVDDYQLEILGWGTCPLTWRDLSPQAQSTLLSGWWMPTRTPMGMAEALPVVEVGGRLTYLTDTDGRVSVPRSELVYPTEVAAKQAARKRWKITG